MSRRPAVELIGVTKRLGGRTILHEFDMSVEQGEVFGLLGPNGAGKTMTIRLIVGLIAPTRGEVLIQGRSIRTDPAYALARVGAVVENPELYGFLTGCQNLLHYLHLSRGVKRNRIEEVVSLLGMEQYIHRKVSTYSLGMRQRLGIAQALLHRPPVLILDEPTNGLDPAGIKELRDYLRGLVAEEDVSVVVSSHILSEMQLMCDRVAVIKQGRLLGVRNLNAGDAPVRLTVDDPGKAGEVIRESFPGLAVSVKGDGVEVDADRDTAARVNERLVFSGVHIYAMQPRARTLEETFMELTGDEHD